MGRFLFFWVSIIFLSGLRAQSTNYSSHSNTDMVSKAVCINANSYYIEKVDAGPIINSSGVLTNYGLDSVNIVGLNAVGCVIFKKNYNQGKDNRIVALKSTNDKALTFVGYSYNCHQMWSQCYFIKSDTLGNEIFKTNLPQLSGSSFTLTLRDFAQHSDSSFYLASDSVVFHVNKGGIYLSKMSTGMAGISSITCLSNGNLLLTGRLNNVNKLVELSTQNSIVNQQTVAEPLKKVKVASSGALFSLGASAYLRSYQANLNALFCSSVSIGASNLIYDFDLKNDTIYVIGFNPGTNQIYYAVLDSNLQMVYQSSPSYKYITPKAITVNSNNRVSVFSNCTSTNKTYSPFISIHQFHRYTYLFSKFDIGVSNVEMQSFTPINSNFLGNVYSFNVTVKNYGNDTIKFFKLNKHLYDDFHACNHGRFNKFYNTTILPYDSVVVSTALYPDGGSSGAPSYSKTFCFFTSIPNAGNDIYTNNDEFCKSISYYVGVKEDEGLNTIDVGIFPNPFTTDFAIQSEYEIKEVKVFNALGVLVRRETDLGKETVLNLGDLEPGIYFVRVETGKVAVTKKVVKN